MAVVEDVALRNFRNYRALDVPLGKPGLYLVVGANGQGKTNFLEALYFCAFLRSFRTSVTRELVRETADEAAVALTIAGEQHHEQLRVRFGAQKRLYRDGCEVRRGSEFINGVLAVALVPDDLQGVAGPPRERRRLLDMLLGQLVPAYLRDLGQYREALLSRNALLRHGDAKSLESVSAFGHVLARHGAALMAARLRLCRRWQKELAELTPRLLTPGDVLALHYAPNVAASEDLAANEQAVRNRLQESWQRDVRERRTTAGPHRDDVALWLNDREVGRYGSQGERRLTALALKLASLGLVWEAKPAGRPVVLLVDDVLGELDGERRRRLLETVMGGADQVFVALTEVPKKGELPVEPVAVLRVNAGQVVVEDENTP